MSHEHVVKLRGLPWSSGADEVLQFLNESSPLQGKESVHMMVNPEGRPNGECFVELLSAQDVSNARKKHRQYMGKRYVEVLDSDPAEFEKAMKQKTAIEKGEYEPPEEDEDANYDPNSVVRLRGLPYTCKKPDIAKFFEGLDITENGILITSDYLGRNAGDAFVHFANRDDVAKALQKNKEMIGHRYIEIFPSNLAEASRCMSGVTNGPPQLNDYPSGGGGLHHDGGGDTDYYGAPPMRGSMRGGGSSFGGPAAGAFGGYGGRGSSRPMPYDRPPMRGNNDQGYGGGMYGGFDPQMDGGYDCGGMSEGFVVRMRGLPFKVTESEIYQWFSSEADPVSVKLIYGRDGRFSGEAHASFATESDAQKAMSKNKQYMLHRYIGLYYGESVTSNRSKML